MRVFRTSIRWWALTGVFSDSKYSRSSQQCWSLNSPNSYSARQLFQSFFLYFGGRFKCTNHNWYQWQPHAPYFVLFFFSSLERSKYFSIFSLSFIFTLEWQNLLDGKFSTFCWINRISCLLSAIRWSACISKSFKILMGLSCAVIKIDSVSHLRFPFYSYVNIIIIILWQFLKNNWPPIKDIDFVTNTPALDNGRSVE